VIGEGSSALHLANANEGKGYLYYDTVILDSEYNVINTLTFDGEVTTTVRADINRDLKVDIVDVAMVAGAFGSYPSSPKWNPACNVNGDKRIDIYDVAYVCHCFGWYDP
jgi:hypothetical protein